MNDAVTSADSITAVQVESSEAIRYRILIPVWGQRYIDGFCEVALPALLSPGNLPALLEHAGCEVIFLTTRSSRAAFESSAGIARLTAVCRYSFVDIDDLIPLRSYGVILTAAYGRGIASMGERQLSTYFIFLNADFVLSDGTLRSVVSRVKAGFNAVMAPSLRCNEEDVADILRSMVSPETAVFEASAEELLRLTMAHLHPTAFASIVNQNVAHHNAANQFFWKVDDTTLLGRYFLLFMLCIRPEKPYTVALGWCDYAFVPDLVPSGNFDVIVDSDDGFILEMQARRGDRVYLQSGRITSKQFAPRLSYWTTATHRAYAARTIIFHAGPLPAGMEAAKADSDRFMAELFAAMKPKPVSHHGHPFWTSAMLHIQEEFGRGGIPEDIAWVRTTGLTAISARYGSPLGALTALRLGTSRRLNRALVGEPPHVSRLHYAYPDYQDFAERVAPLRGRSGAVLYIKEDHNPFDRIVVTLGSVITVELDELVRPAGETASHVIGCVVIVVNGSGLDRVFDAFDFAVREAGDSVPIFVCVDGIQGVFHGAAFNLSSDLTDRLLLNLPRTVEVDDLHMLDASTRLTPHYRLLKMRDMLLSGGLTVWLAAALVLPPAFLRMFYVNYWRGRPDNSRAIVCTSATFFLRRRTPPTARAE